LNQVIMRKLIIIFTCCVAVLLLGYTAYRGYSVWKQSHWMALAKSFAVKGDVPNEFLALEQVLRSNPRDIAACRMMAGLAEAAHSPSALTWRERVVELDPNSADDRLALAQTAIFSHDLTTAQSALAGVGSADKNTAAFYSVSGTLALAMNNPGEAEADFTQSIRLAPSDLAPQLNLAVIELHDTNSLNQEEARITLKRISMESTNVFTRDQAKRELIVNSLQIGDNDTALSYSRELVIETNANFSDKLLRLDVLRKAKSSEYQRTLRTYEYEAGNNSDELYQLTMWLMARNLPTQAFNWIQTLPANIRTNQPAAVLSAQCESLMQDWSGLQNSLSQQNWGALDYMRHAYMAHALREQGLYDSSKAEWEVAVRSANGQDRNLTALFRFTAQWNWQTEAQQILTTIVNNFPQEQWAASDLIGMLYANGSTRPLMQVFALLASRNPSDLDARNNLALTAMLLHAQEQNPYAVIRDVYQKSPANPNYACTYAFSLYLQGNNAGALKIMQQLKPDDLKNNSTAGYYGIILKTAGDNAAAKAYLAISLKGQLLPEERDLFTQAMSSL
jgi:thioredoxin-like negative regulator of GroEL